MGIPLPENRKIEHCHCMFFDRYAIHIQAFVNFIYPIFMGFRSSSWQIVINMKYSTFQKTVKTIDGFHQKNATWLPYLQQMIFSKLFQGFFLISSRCPGVSKDKWYWFWGGLDTSQNPEIMEFGVLGFSIDEIGILFYLIEAD